MQAAHHFIKRYLLIVVMVLTNAGFGWALFGCSPATVHIVSADAAGFQQWLHEGMASDARRPAQLMQSYVRGQLPEKPGVLEDDLLPEPYNLAVGPSIRESE